MRKLKFLKTFESLLDVEPEQGKFKEEILKNIKEVLVKNLKRDQIKHWKISPSYNILADYCKDKFLIKQDVIDFIDWEIGIRKPGQDTPSLKKDQDFINMINKVIEEYQKRYKWI